MVEILLFDTDISKNNARLTFTHASSAISAKHIIAYTVTAAIGWFRIVTFSPSDLKAIGAP